jgi:hypothetical protein
LVLFIEPHYDDFVLSAGIYSTKRPIDKVLTVFSSERNTGGTRALCSDLGKDYYEFGFSNIDWKNPTIIFKAKDFHNALVTQLKNVTLILTVLGVGNYAHKFLSQYLIDHFAERIPILFFRDFPHAYDETKLYHIPFEEYIKEFQLVEALGNDSDYTKKIDLFKKYYPSQKSLLWFEREQFSNPVQEEIYKVKPTISLW